MQRKLCMHAVVSLNACIANAQSKPDSQASAAALLKAGRVLDGVSTQVGLSIRFSGPINFGDYPGYQGLDKDLSEKLCFFPEVIAVFLVTWWAQSNHGSLRRMV